MSYHIFLCFRNWFHRKHSYCATSATAISDSSPSTSHSQKIQLTISPNLHWLSLLNIRHTRFGSISKRIDSILAWIYTEIHCPDPGCTCWKYSQVEKTQDVSLRLLSLLPFLNFNHVHLHIQPYTTATIQTLYHIFGGSVNHFFISHSPLWLHLTFLLMPLHLHPHCLVATHRRSKTSAECKYHSIVLPEICHR